MIVNPGWGDAVQANKAGLLEIADVFVVNKADGPGAEETARDLEQMLDLAALAGSRPPVVTTTSHDGEGVADSGGPSWITAPAPRPRRARTTTPPPRGRGGVTRLVAAGACPPGRGR